MLNSLINCSLTLGSHTLSQPWSVCVLLFHWLPSYTTCMRVFVSDPPPRRAALTLFIWPGGSELLWKTNCLWMVKKEKESRHKSEPSGVDCKWLLKEGLDGINDTLSAGVWRGVLIDNLAKCLFSQNVAWRFAQSFEQLRWTFALQITFASDCSENSAVR